MVTMVQKSGFVWSMQEVITFVPFLGTSSLECTPKTYQRRQFEKVVVARFR